MKAKQPIKTVNGANMAKAVRKIGETVRFASFLVLSPIDGKTIMRWYVFNVNRSAEFLSEENGGTNDRLVQVQLYSEIPG